MRRWIFLLLLALPAAVAIWSGWVGLGQMTGFGVVHPLPGICDRFTINSAITLPVGVETYAFFGIRAWLTGTCRLPGFARVSAIGSLVLGAGGQVAYHLMASRGVAVAPWWITTIVACLPVGVVGMGAALYHLQVVPTAASPADSGHSGPQAEEEENISSAPEHPVRAVSDEQIISVIANIRGSLPPGEKMRDSQIVREIAQRYPGSSRPGYRRINRLKGATNG